MQRTESIVSDFHLCYEKHNGLRQLCTLQRPLDYLLARSLASARLVSRKLHRFGLRQETECILITGLSNKSLVLNLVRTSVSTPVRQKVQNSLVLDKSIQSNFTMRGSTAIECCGRIEPASFDEMTTAGSEKGMDSAGFLMERKESTELQHLENFETSTAPPQSANNGDFSPKQNAERWTSKDWPGQVDVKKQIFCNRSLNMKSIVAVGFDMDYTLAQYKPETFETMAYHGTIKKLVFDLGYPEELLQWKFDWQYMVRGLVLDKRRGNILKMDRHKYVKVAYHGFCEMSREDRMATYGISLSREAYDEPDYALIDTLFSLAEAYLFAQLVQFRDIHPEKIPVKAKVKSDSGTAMSFNYSQMYKDVRDAVDLCHRDGTLKQAVAKNPSKYVNYDPHLISMLKMLRDSGRMTFLVTNSLWDYTHVAMNYLCGKCGSDGGKPRDDEWLNYFDLVITGSAKPSFFAEGNRAALFEVDIKSGMLLNTNNGTPLVQVGDIGFTRLSFTLNGTKQPCHVFQGGNVAHLHWLLKIEAGSQVLYVGDHIYGDILRSKKLPGWRTMLVVPELEEELAIYHQTTSIRKVLGSLRQKRDIIEDKLQRLDWSLRFNKSSRVDRNNMLLEREELQAQRDNVREVHRQAQKEYHEMFHKTWGQLMKTGYQNSRFAHQVERFACLYTSQVSNLCYYSPDKSYRTSEDFMPHEMGSFKI